MTLDIFSLPIISIAGLYRLLDKRDFSSVIYFSLMLELVFQSFFIPTLMLVNNIMGSYWNNFGIVTLTLLFFSGLFNGFEAFFFEEHSKPTEETF